MPGTITSDLTAGVIDAAEAVTGWLAIVTWAKAAAASVDIVLQGTYAINAQSGAVAAYPPATCGWQLAATSSNLILDESERHVYAWLKTFSWPATEARVRGGMRILIASEVTPTISGTSPWQGVTNSKQWFVGGADINAVSGWDCFVVNPTGTPDMSIGSPNMHSVNRVGFGVAMIKTVGGGAIKPQNIIWDKVAYGTGLTIIDGTSPAPVTMSDIYATDMSNANCFGVITKTSGIYFVAGKLLFGTTGQTALTYFKDTNQVLVYQDFPVASTFYEIKLVGASGFTTTAQFGDYTSGLISGGCVLRGGGLTTQRAIAPVIVSGGNPTYVVGDILSVSGGTYTTQAKVVVITVNAGVITELRMSIAGAYSVPPTGTLTLTGGGGSGATCTLTFTGGSIWTLTASAAYQTLNLYGCTLSEMKSAALSSTSTLRGCTFDNFGNITVNGTFFDSCTFQNLRTTTPISATYAVQAQTTIPTLTNCKFINCATALLWPIAFNPNGKLDGTTFISGGTGHAIEITGTATDITLNNVIFSGYSGTSTNAAVYVNIFSGTMSITITGGGTDITGKVRTEGATVTVVSGAVSATLTVKNTAVPPVAIQDARVLVIADTGGPFPYDVTVTIINSGTTATVTHTTHGLATNDKVQIKGANLWQNNGVFSITNVDASTYTYTLPEVPGSSPTGTIKATFAVLEGLTNASGVITMNRVFSSVQPVTGRARKSSGTPIYKTTSFVGSVSATAGMDLTVQLLSDE